MYPFKKILVGLNLGPRDETVLKYTGMFARMFEAEEVTFITVITTPEVPQTVGDEFPEIMEQDREPTEDKLNEAVAAHFEAPEGTRVNCEVHHGDRLKTILQSVREKDLDLVIVGKKRESEASGLLPEKLARKVPCSALLLSGEPQVKFGSILVAMDFSKHSVDALETALAIAQAYEIQKLDCLHVYEVPSGYSRTGKSYDDFAAIMERNARKECEKFFDRIDTRGIEINHIFELNSRPSKSISEIAEERDSDLLVVGARGRSVGAAIFMGSVTERLFRLTERPVLAVKKKGECLGLFDALIDVL